VATKPIPAPLARDLHLIAYEILSDHAERGRELYFGAVPYVDAMRTFGTTDLSARHGEDDAATVVLYALSNLSTWRGPVAARVKAELRAALADHQQGARRG
jgi:hypothetical protein